MPSPKPPKPTLIKNCNNQIDINSTEMDNKLQYWIELDHIKLFYKISYYLDLFLQCKSESNFGYLVAYKDPGKLIY